MKSRVELGAQCPWCFAACCPTSSGTWVSLSLDSTVCTPHVNAKAHSSVIFGNNNKRRNPWCGPLNFLDYVIQFSSCLRAAETFLRKWNGIRRAGCAAGGTEESICNLPQNCVIFQFHGTNGEMFCPFYLLESLDIVQFCHYRWRLIT
jgi:hypothetical protein